MFGNQQGFGLLSSIMGVAITSIMAMALSAAMSKSMQMSQAIDRKEERRVVARQLQNDNVNCREIKQSCEGASDLAPTPIKFLGDLSVSFVVKSDGSVATKDNRWWIKAHCIMDLAGEPNFFFKIARTDAKSGELVTDQFRRGSFKAEGTKTGWEELYGDLGNPVCSDEGSLEAGLRFEKNFQKPSLVTAFTPNAATLREAHREANHRAVVSCSIPTAWPWSKTKSVPCEQGVRFKDNDQNPMRLTKSVAKTGKVAGYPSAQTETCRWIEVRAKSGSVLTFPHTPRNRLYGINGKPMVGWARGYSPSQFCVGGVTYDSEVGRDGGGDRLTATNDALLQSLFGMAPADVLNGGHHRLVANQGAAADLVPLDPDKPLLNGDMIVGVLDQSIAAPKALSGTDALAINKQAFMHTVRDQWLNGSPSIKLKIKQRKSNGAYGGVVSKEFELPPNE